MEELYIDKNTRTFNQIEHNHELPPSDFFYIYRYFMRIHLPNFESINTHSYMESINKCSLIDKGIMFCYKTLTNNAEMVNINIDWEDKSDRWGNLGGMSQQ